MQESYKTGVKPNAGAIALDCNQKYHNNMREFMHGKIIESTLRGKIQAIIGQNVDLCKISPAIRDDVLASFADAIWNNA